MKIKIMESCTQSVSQKHIFICSTVKNLKYVRQIIADYIQRCGHIAYANELPEFPVQGNLHPMDECLEIVKKKATHFILLIGERWGLPYYEDPSLSIAEKEFFEANGKIPILCFIEENTWNEAVSYHKQNRDNVDKSSNIDHIQSINFSTDVRVLEFIDKHLMHDEVKWITPFSHIKDITQKLAFSWLVSETKPYNLFFSTENEATYIGSICEYADAFVSFLLNQSLLPIPKIDLPEKDKNFIAVNRTIGHRLGKEYLVDPFDCWIKIFEEIKDRLNLALQTSYNVILKGKTEKNKNEFDVYYPREFKKVIRRSLENYLDFARIRFYGEETYGKIPNLAGMELSTKSDIIIFAIHSKLECKKEEIVRLEMGLRPHEVSLKAYIPISTLKKWEKYCASEYFSEYNKFLMDWATLIIPQVFAFSKELPEYIIEKLIHLNFNKLLGVRVHNTNRDEKHEFLIYLRRSHQEGTGFEAKK